MLIHATLLSALCALDCFPDTHLKNLSNIVPTFGGSFPFNPAPDTSAPNPFLPGILALSPFSNYPHKCSWSLFPDLQALDPFSTTYLKKLSKLCTNFLCGISLYFFSPYIFFGTICFPLIIYKTDRISKSVMFTLHWDATFSQKQLRMEGRTCGALM